MGDKGAKSKGTNKLTTAKFPAKFLAVTASMQQRIGALAVKNLSKNGHNNTNKPGS